MVKRTVRKKTAAKKTSQKKKTASPRSVKAKTGIATTREIKAATKERQVRSARALRVYAAGVTAVQKRKFSIAAKALNEIVDDYPEERDLLERARLYLAV